MFISYAACFFRVVIGLVFGISVVGKCKDVGSFKRTITKFRVFPAKYTNGLTLLILLGETSTVIAMILGGNYLFWGFLLAIALFLSFSIALALVLIKGIDTSCNCFGPHNKKITHLHVIRSAGLMASALIGWLLNSLWHSQLHPIDILGWLLIGAVAGTFLLIWIQLDDVVQLLK
jgi:hypothetical protein